MGLKNQKFVLMLENQSFKQQKHQKGQPNNQMTLN